MDRKLPRGLGDFPPDPIEVGAMAIKEAVFIRVVHLNETEREVLRECELGVV